MVESVELESDGKEIHIEIFPKVFALGFRVRGIPATPSGRRKGRSKFKFAATPRSHLLFSFFEKPMLLFGLVGLVCVALGAAGGAPSFRASFHGPFEPWATFVLPYGVIDPRRDPVSEFWICRHSDCSPAQRDLPDSADVPTDVSQASTRKAPEIVTG